MSDLEKYAIGVDLGGTKIEIALVDKKGTTHEHVRFPTHSERGAQEIIQEIIQNIQKILSQVTVKVEGIGIGVAGQVDPEDGRVIFAPNLKWHDVKLKEELEVALKLPVFITNDVRAITWGEWLFGAGKGCEDLVCVFIGTGIGSGIVSRGQMLAGSSNTAGELGHMIIDLNGPLCTCGNKGCYEALAGGWAIAKMAQEAIEQNRFLSTMIQKLADEQKSAVNAKIVFQGYRQQDPLAIEIVEKIKPALIAGMVSIVHAFNPEMIILGGGVVEGLPEIIEVIDTGVKKRALKAAAKNLQIVRAKIRKEVGVIGAAALVMH